MKTLQNPPKTAFLMIPLLSSIILLTLIFSQGFIRENHPILSTSKLIPSAQAAEFEIITPTMHCLGGNPCTSPNPPTSPTGNLPTNPPIASSQGPTLNPCLTQDASTQSHDSRKKRMKSYNRTTPERGFFSQLFEFLLRILEMLLRQLGFLSPDTTPIPGTPDNTSPTGIPGNNNAPTTDPCASYTTPGPITPTQDPGTPSIYTPPPSPSGTVTQGLLTASGKNLMLDGKVYKYVGVNAFQLGGTVEHGADYSKEELDAFFSALPPRSLTRVWAWNNSNMDQMRRAVQSAEEHNQLLILVLSEGAGWDSVGQKPDSWYQEDYKNYLLPWVDQVVGEFKNSQAIGIWEIMNEPAGDQQNPSHEAVKGFMSTVAARIKQNDPVHLVGTGAIRCSVPGFGEGCADINNDPNIDVMSSHDYTGDQTITSTFFEDKQQLDAINKPWILGEAGIKGGDYDGGGGSCPRSGAERAQMIKQKIDAYFADGRVSGVNLWVYKKDATCASNNDGFDFNLTDPIMEVMRSYTLPQ